MKYQLSLSQGEIEFLKNSLWYQSQPWDRERNKILYFFSHHVNHIKLFPCPYSIWWLPNLVTQNIANFVSLRLSSTNFLLWKTQMLNILESYDKALSMVKFNHHPSSSIMLTLAHKLILHLWSGAKLIALSKVGWQPHSLRKFLALL